MFSKYVPSSKMSNNQASHFAPARLSRLQLDGDYMEMTLKGLNNESDEFPFQQSNIDDCHQQDMLNSQTYSTPHSQESNISSLSSSSQQDEEEKWIRERCPHCKRNYMFYCGLCYIPLGVPKKAQIPHLKLPVTVDIYFQDGFRKSTAPQAKVVAPDCVNILPLSEPILDYDYSTSVVVYPSKDAVEISELEDLQKVKTFVFIDCPWKKSGFVKSQRQLCSLRSVKLHSTPSSSKFWRYHSAGPGCVSTIEEYKEAMGSQIKDETDYGNLLFYFNRLYDYIIESRMKLSNSNVLQLPMNEAEKHRQRELRNQAEKGKLIRQERKAKKMKESLVVIPK